MPGMWVGAGGIWKKVSRPRVGAASAHKQWTIGYIGAGGAWKKFFTLAAVNSFSMSANYGLPYRCVGIKIKTSGTVWSLRNTTSSFPSEYQQLATWLSAGAPADFQVQLVKTSGTMGAAASGSKVLNTWYGLSGDPSWYFYVPDGTANTTYTFFGTINFRIISTGEILPRGSVSIWIPD